MLKQDLKIETWAMDRLIPYARNARLRQEAAVVACARLESVAWRRDCAFDFSAVSAAGGDYIVYG
jgi:hypothetical protein